MPKKTIRTKAELDVLIRQSIEVGNAVLDDRLAPKKAGELLRNLNAGKKVGRSLPRHSKGAAKRASGKSR